MTNQHCSFLVDIFYSGHNGGDNLCAEGLYTFCNEVGLHKKEIKYMTFAMKVHTLEIIFGILDIFFLDLGNNYQDFESALKGIMEA